MDRSRFKHYLAQLDTLTAGQREQLLAALKNQITPLRSRRNYANVNDALTRNESVSIAGQQASESTGKPRISSGFAASRKTVARRTPRSPLNVWRRCVIVPSGHCFRIACDSAPPCMKRHSDAEFATSPRSAGAIACSPTYATLNRCAGWSR